MRILALWSILIGLSSIKAAPLEAGTDIAVLPKRQEACWYKGERVKDGGQVNTGEPCLSCMCKKGALVCDLQVCPHYQAKLPPPGCFLVERKKACCPKLVCPGVESNRLDRQSNEQLAAWKVKHEIRQRLTKQLSKTVSDRSGCLFNGTTYADGSAMMTSTSCEYCYCIRGEQRCMKPRCAAPMPGCAPRYRELSCCPSHYDCTSAIDALTSLDGSSARRGNKPGLAGVRGNDRIIDLLPKQNQNQPASVHVVKRQVPETATSEGMTETAVGDLTTPDDIVEEMDQDTNSSSLETSETSLFDKSETQTSSSSDSPSSTTQVSATVANADSLKPVEEIHEQPASSMDRTDGNQGSVEEIPTPHRETELTWNHPLAAGGDSGEFVPSFVQPEEKEEDDEEEDMLVEVKSVIRPGSVDGFPSQPEFIPGKLTPIGGPLPDLDHADPEHIDYGSTEPPSLLGISIVKFVPSDAVTPVMPIITAGGPEANLPVTGFAPERNPLGTRGSALSKTSFQNEFLLPRRPDAEESANFPSRPFQPIPFQGLPPQRFSSPAPPRAFPTPPPTTARTIPTTTTAPPTSTTVRGTTRTTISPLLAFTVTFPPKPSNAITTTTTSITTRTSKLTPESPSTTPKSAVTPATIDRVDTNAQLRVQGCNIYGHMYQVGGIIEKLSNPCIECICTAAGVECNALSC